MSRRIRFFLGVLASLLLLAICVEAGTRLLHPRLFGVPFAQEYVGRALGLGDGEAGGEEVFDPIGATAFADEYVLHPYLGFVSDPRSLNFVGELRFSRFGFPGVDMRLKRAEGERIVVITGGSVAMGLYGASSGNLASALERVPAFMGSKVRVVCLALPGYKQPQQLMALAYFLSLGAEFDVVINLDGFNEITLPIIENLPQHSHPIYPRSWNPFADAALDKENFMLVADVIRLQERRKAIRKSMAGSVLRNSAFAFSLWEVRDRRLQQTTRRRREEWNARLAEMPRSPMTAGPSFGEEPMSTQEALDESVQIWRRCSRQMAALCEANGIIYVHFLQPNQYVPDSKPLSDEEKRIAYVEGAYKTLVEVGYPRLQAGGEWLGAEGVAFIDLTDVFKEETRTVYIDNCCHPNEFGYEIIAAHIARTIARELDSP